MTDGMIAKLKKEPFNRDVDLDMDDLERELVDVRRKVAISKNNQVDANTKNKIQRAVVFYVETWKKRKRIVDNFLRVIEVRESSN